MIKRNSVDILRNSMWTRVLTISIILFFVYLGDAILSDWVPTFMQETLGGSMLMGLVFSFSSVVGFVTDFTFPRFLKKFKPRKLFLMAMGMGLVFAGILLWTTSWPWAVLFLMAMAVWGIYYELLWFGSAQFVCDSVHLESRSGVWGVIGIFKSLAYFLGPILGTWLVVSKGNSMVILAAAAMMCLAYVIWMLTRRNERNYEVEMETENNFNVWEEMSHWKVLFAHVWPALLISLMMGIVDATYWTTGTVMTDNLAKENALGSMFLPLYMLPTIFMGIVLARKGVYRGKKKIAEIFLLISGGLLICLGLKESLYVTLLLSFLIGVALAVSWPMVDAVYTDILARMGRERKHMVGLPSSMVSLSYVVGPIMAGVIASIVGEKMTFAVVGAMVIIVAGVLLLVTPKKLKLPQTEIAEWKD
jgi:MFS family permease